MLGGKVDFMFPDKKKLTGLREINFVDRNGFWQGLKKGQFIVSHRETVTELGPDCGGYGRGSMDGFRYVCNLTQRLVLGLSETKV